MRSGSRIWQAQCKRASVARLTFHCDVAANEIGETLRNCEAESGAAPLAGARLVALPERLEHRGEVVCRNTNAGVCHTKVHSIRLCRDVHPDAAAVRELHCVAEQIQQDLAQLARIGQKSCGRICSIDCELEMLLICEWLDDGAHFFDQLLQIYGT